MWVWLDKILFEKITLANTRTLPAEIIGMLGVVDPSADVIFWVGVDSTIVVISSVGVESLINFCNP